MFQIITSLQFLLLLLLHISSASSLIPYARNVPKLIPIHHTDPVLANLDPKIRVEPIWMHLYPRTSPPESPESPLIAAVHPLIAAFHPDSPPNDVPQPGPSEVELPRPNSPRPGTPRPGQAQTEPWSIPIIQPERSSQLNLVHRPYQPVAATPPAAPLPAPPATHDIAPPQQVMTHEIARPAQIPETHARSICSAYRRTRDAWRGCTRKERIAIGLYCCSVLGLCEAVAGAGMWIGGTQQGVTTLRDAGLVLFPVGMGTCMTFIGIATLVMREGH